MEFLQNVKDSKEGSTTVSASGDYKDYLIFNGWYSVVWDYPLDHEYKKYSSPPVIDDVAKTVTYTSVDKTLQETEAYRSDQAQLKIKSVRDAVILFESSQITGSGIGILTLLVSQNNAKGIAVQNWIRAIWNEYYTRKAMYENNWAEPLNTSFESFGDIPYSIPELIAEFDTINNV